MEDFSVVLENMNWIYWVISRDIYKGWCSFVSIEKIGKLIFL